MGICCRSDHCCNSLCTYLHWKDCEPLIKPEGFSNARPMNYQSTEWSFNNSTFALWLWCLARDLCAHIYSPERQTEIVIGPFFILPFNGAEFLCIWFDSYFMGMCFVSQLMCLCHTIPTYRETISSNQRLPLVIRSYTALDRRRISGRPRDFYK